MKRISIILLAAAAAITATGWADEALERELKQDIVLRAVVDELERGRTTLELEDMERPYFIEYSLMDHTGAYVSADLGAVTGRGERRYRWLRTEVRVGSYELDNTNFAGDYGGFYGRYMRMGQAPVPIEDDYNAIRQAVWWSTDREYKSVIEALERKKAFMEGKMIEDKPDDFSQEPPAVYLEERIEPDVAVARLEELAVALSRVFRQYPDIQDSGVSVSGSGGNKYLVNSEGTRLRTSGTDFAISVSASVQADDGMPLSDSFYAVAPTLDEFPSLDELTQRCRQMADTLIAIKNAPVLQEPYTGPVLFDAESATNVFSQHFAGQFSGGQRPVGSQTSPDDFANKLDKRILPRFLNVVDDPTRATVAGERALGSYVYDDQGVKAQPVTLVEQGRLKALLMSRNPSKECQHSNGHGRGSYGSSAGIGCLTIDSSEGSDEKALEQELLDACEDEDLEYGIRISSGSQAGRGGRRYASMFGFGGGSGGGNPLAMYKVYPDGRQELVRGAEIAHFDLKAFKRILAAGDTPYVDNIGGWSDGCTVAAPALLFEELDLAKIDRDFDKPPILPNPVGRATP